MKQLNIADLFCGAGGTSSGAIEAIQALGFQPKLTAINHWPVAVDTHTFNHPDARHLCTAVDEVNPRSLYRPGELNLLWASPECTHHSNARGGAPTNEQSRATAWCVPRWMEAARPDVVLVENVPEFAKWGEKKNGRTFAGWFEACCSMGYKGEARVLTAADYGDPTTRRRLIVQFQRGRRKIVWPDATHAEDASGGLLPWVPASEIIDWNHEGQSIFERERPLSPKTLNRIYEGLKKFGLKAMTMSAGGPECPARPVDAPLGTVLCRDHRALAEPFLICMEHGGRVVSSGRPMPTITTARGGAIGVAWPSIALCEPSLLPQGGGGALRPVSEPAPTIHCDGAVALVEPFLVNYYGNGNARSVRKPLDTVTTKDRFGLVRPVVIYRGERYWLDIRFRMLQVRELAAAQGFHPRYRFTGTKTEQVKQIGNAVPRNLARAVVLAAWGQIPNVAKAMKEAA